MSKFNLEDRLIQFAVHITDSAENLPKTYLGIHLSKQITRSGTSPALNYGEAQAAESKADFIHKMKIALKELRETYVCLKIILKKKLINEKTTEMLISENNELISIFVASIKTAKSNLK